MGRRHSLWLSIPVVVVAVSIAAHMYYADLPVQAETQSVGVAPALGVSLLQHHQSLVQGTPTTKPCNKDGYCTCAGFAGCPCTDLPPCPTTTTTTTTGITTTPLPQVPLLASTGFASSQDEDSKENNSEDNNNNNNNNNDEDNNNDSENNNNSEDNDNNNNNNADDNNSEDNNNDEDNNSDDNNSEDNNNDEDNNADDNNNNNNNSDDNNSDDSGGDNDDNEGDNNNGGDNDDNEGDNNDNSDENLDDKSNSDGNSNADDNDNSDEDGNSDDNSDSDEDSESDEDSDSDDNGSSDDNSNSDDDSNSDDNSNSDDDSTSDDDSNLDGESDDNDENDLLDKKPNGNLGGFKKLVSDVSKEALEPIQKKIAELEAEVAVLHQDETEDYPELLKPLSVRLTDLRDQVYETESEMEKRVRKLEDVQKDVMTATAASQKIGSAFNGIADTAEEMQDDFAVSKKRVKEKVQVLNKLSDTMETKLGHVATKDGLKGMVKNVKGKVEDHLSEAKKNIAKHVEKTIKSQGGDYKKIRKAVAKNQKYLKRIYKDLHHTGFR